MSRPSGSPRVPFAVFLVAICVGCMAVGWIGSRHDLRPFAPLGAPLFAWLAVARNTRQYFQYSWFWWTSVLFIGASAIAVSQVDVAPPGSGLLRWILIVLVEMVLFVVAVTLQRPNPVQNGEHHDSWR